MTDLRSFSSEQLDAIKEVGMVGLGNAATALSQLVNKTIESNLPLLRILPKENIEELLKEPKAPGVGVYLKVLGKIEGQICALFPKEHALLFLDYLLDVPLGTTREFHQLEQSAIKEISHILSSSYLSALSQLLGSFLIPTVAEISFGSLDFLLKEVFEERHKGEYILGIEGQLKVKPTKFDFYIFFFPNPEFLEELLTTLGM